VLTSVGKRYLLFPTMYMLKTQHNPTRPFSNPFLKHIFIVVKLVTYNFAVSHTLIISVSRNLNAKWQKWADVRVNSVHYFKCVKYRGR
jgi:hypothetical protein